MTSLVDTVRAPPRYSLHAFMSTGFRPFFLMAATFGSLIVPTWIVLLQRGDVLLPVSSSLWHAHEMIYGFVVAVVAGFLLTAVRNWTGGLATAHGRPLAFLMVIWIAGRLAMLPNLGLEPAMAMAINALFLPAVMLFVIPPLAYAKNRRNYKIVGVLTALWCLQLLFYAELAGVSLLPGGAGGALQAALGMLVILCLVITGRIVPAFTKNATRQEGIRRWEVMERFMMGSAVATFVLDIFHLSAPLAQATAFLTGSAIVARMRHWGTFHTLKNPLLWVLHVGNLWLAAGFLLRTLDLFGVSAALPLASHAFAFGGIGTLILGMLTRVTLGHTGRPLRASQPMTIAFALFTLGAVVRVFFPLTWPMHYLLWIKISGSAWTLAFVLFLFAQGSMLVRQRADGACDCPQRKRLPELV